MARFNKHQLNVRGWDFLNGNLLLCPVKTNTGQEIRFSAQTGTIFIKKIAVCQIKGIGELEIALTTLTGKIWFYPPEPTRMGEKEAANIAKQREAAKPEGYREPGSILFFEYHCTEDHGSSDAEIWYRSHCKVTVLECCNLDEHTFDTRLERAERGEPLTYKVRFEDGLEWEMFEDELLDSESDYFRPDPPPKPSLEVIAAARAKFGYSDWPAEMIRLPTESERAI